MSVMEHLPEFGACPSKMAAHGTIGDTKTIGNGPRVEVGPVRQQHDCALLDAELFDGGSNLGSKRRKFPPLGSRNFALDRSPT